jgi:hypothetical protein
MGFLPLRRGAGCGDDGLIAVWITELSHAKCGVTALPLFRADLHGGGHRKRGGWEQREQVTFAIMTRSEEKGSRRDAECVRDACDVHHD